MISIFDYRSGLATLEQSLHDALQRVLDSNRLVLGPETEAFEEELASWAGVRHCVAVTSGTAAIFVALRGLGVGSGDEVITVANTCPPTVSAIRLTGAIPVFVDVDPATLMMDMDLLETAITPRTRAIVPVHLWGNAVEMRTLCELANRAEIPVVEDCAQAAGTRIYDRQVGTYGSVGCFSFYPSKNLGGYGDGGAVITNDAALADVMRRLRMYGYDGSPVSTVEGVNARINELQAAFLRVKLPFLESWNARRRSVADRYRQALSRVVVPATTSGTTHCYHQFVVRCDDRADVVARLDAAEIGWGIHYERPVHRMPAFERFSRELPVTERAASEILSLPVHEYLSDDDVSSVIDAIEL
ncbi:MAG: DegT/DnrJ/EryC1/StrS family aminotransferase [Pseudomonadota bacterium]